VFQVDGLACPKAHLPDSFVSGIIIFMLLSLCSHPSLRYWSHLSRKQCCWCSALYII